MNSSARIILLIALLTISTAIQAQRPPATNDAAELLRTGLELYRQGRLDEALTNCTKAIALNPKDYRSHVLLGYVYGAQQKLKEASEAFAKAIRLEPKDKEVYLLKAQVDFLRNAQKEALAAAKKAVALDPNYGEAHLMVGALLKWDSKRTNEAIAAYEAALKNNPKLVDAYEGLGEIFESEKQYQKAEEAFRKGMAADPKKMSGRFPLALMLVQQGRLVEARKVWEGRTSDDGDRTMPRFIVLLERAERLKHATDAAVQDPNNPDALIELGMAIMDGDAWVINDRQKRAIVHFRKALELRPDDSRAQLGIVKAYIEIADVFDEENKNVDIELAKLKQLDPKLAAQMEAYRKNFRGELIALPPKP